MGDSDCETWHIYHRASQHPSHHTPPLLLLRLLRLLRLLQQIRRYGTSVPELKQNLLHIHPEASGSISSGERSWERPTRKRNRSSRPSQSKVGAAKVSMVLAHRRHMLTCRWPTGMAASLPEWMILASQVRPDAILNIPFVNVVGVEEVSLRKICHFCPLIGASAKSHRGTSRMFGGGTGKPKKTRNISPRPLCHELRIMKKAPP